jgi:hypothetical protein
VAQDDAAHEAYPRPPEIVGLVAAMPYLCEETNRFERDWSDEPGLLYLYVDVIWDWLNPLLENDSDIDPAFFGWLEDLATSSSRATRNFLSAGLLEVMGDNARWLERLRRHMGPATVMASVETEASWGRPEPERR